MGERKVEPVAWITRQVLKPNQTVVGEWNPLLVSSRCEGDTWSPVYTAHQIRQAVDAVRVEKYYGDEYTAAEVDAALDALLAELGIQEDR